MKDNSNSSSTPPPTPQDIQAHLYELNLATDVKLKEHRQEWFREHKIRVKLVQGTFFVIPDCTNPLLFLEHLAYANMYVSMLADELKWMKEHHYVVKLEKHGTHKKYVFVEELLPQAPEQVASPATVQKEDE